MKHLFFILSILFYSLSVKGVEYQENNNSTDKYIDINGDTIYYRVTGNGKPLVLLHGGLYGSIDDFEPYIKDLSYEFMTIAISTRGYYRSDLGKKDLSYKLLASDVAEIIKKETNLSAIILGFSDGAITAYKFASLYPGLTHKVITLAGAINRNQYKDTTWITEINLEKALAEKPEKMKKLLLNMKSPEKIDELIVQLKKMWNAPIYTSEYEIKNIVAPTLIIGGDRDNFFNVETFTEIYRLLPNSELLILPKTTHKLLSKELFINYILPFIRNNK